MIKNSFLCTDYQGNKNYSVGHVNGCPIIVFLMGPTASGKTSIAIALKKQKSKIEIISVDSALVYKGMNIGTAKPTGDELKIAPHKLIDIRDPVDCYSVSDFYRDVLIEIKNIIASDCIPVLVGGTMLYFKVLLQGLFCLPSSNRDIRNHLEYEARNIGWINMYQKLQRIDPIASRIIHWNDHKRIIRALEVFLISGKTLTELKKCPCSPLQYKVLQFAIMPSNREILNNRIQKRFYHMLELGFEYEVSMLFARSDLHHQLRSSISCVGYRQMWEYLLGNIKYDHMILQGIYATKKLAKQQLTWLKNWPNLHWLNSDYISVAVDNILTVLSKNLYDV